MGSPSGMEAANLRKEKTMRRLLYLTALSMLEVIS
jgi:hypothetical protein